MKSFVQLCFFLLLPALLATYPATAFGQGGAPPLASLRPYTGIWDMPNARVLPDWNIRLKFGDDDPFRYYGVAIGLLDRLEVYGQITEITNEAGFAKAPGVNYGNDKDRSVGAKLVLLREQDGYPQVAAGVNDPFGTKRFTWRYMALSKALGDFDLTIGLGQGILGGETADEINRTTGSLGFLLTSPFRKTEPFGGVEYHLTPDLTLSAEYSSIHYQGLARLSTGGGVEEEPRVPVNVGLKYQLFDHVSVQAAYTRGREAAAGLNLDLPLEPEGMLVWKKDKPYAATDRKQWQAYEADNAELARLVAEEMHGQGFSDVEVSAGGNTLWIEAVNNRSLSDARAFARMGAVANGLAPERIDIFYLNLKRNGQVVESLKTGRAHLAAFMDSRIGREDFLDFAELDMYGTRHWNEFRSQAGASELRRADEDILSYSILPRVKTLVEDPANFFLNKAVVQAQAEIRPWTSGTLSGLFEVTLFNDFGKAINAKQQLEPEAARTDWLRYEERSGPRLSELAFDQTFPLPWDFRGRAAVGYFESEYAGIGGEAFRLFSDGRWGVGVESELVRKRAFDNNFGLREDEKRLFDTAFLNLYYQLWPEEGIEAGLKLGRFLAGDLGGRLELRRSFNYFTVGGWVTATKGGDFQSSLNQGYKSAGVYITIPISLFKDSDVPGHFTYEITGFQRDAGQLASQPNSLYPMNPWSTPDYVKRNLDDMRGSK